MDCGVLMALEAEKLAVSVSSISVEEGSRAPHPQKMVRSGLERPEMNPEERRHLAKPHEMRTGLYGPLLCTP